MNVFWNPDQDSPGGGWELDDINVFESPCSLYNIVVLLYTHPNICYNMFQILSTKVMLCIAWRPPP